MTPNNDESDAELVAKARGGDGHAFGCLYDRYARLVRAVLAGDTDGSLKIQDLAQESFLRAYQKLARLRRPDRFRFWLVGIARRVAREARRTSRRDRHQFIESRTLELVTAANADRAVQIAEETELVMRQLAALTKRERLAIHAFFLEECDARQAAELLGLSRSGVYALLTRALARLAEKVRESETEEGR